MPLLSRLRVSENGRFLITETGKPFFWLGDTAWELFHRLTEEDARLYLANRKKNRFTVIQAVILAELDGLNTPNPYGERPFINNNPTQPNEAYFAYVDKVITMAADLGLYMAVLPTWGDKVTPLWGKGPVIFNQETAYIYGQFLGKRYKNYSNIVWMLGGDRPPVHENNDYRPIWRALAQGLDEGASGIKVLKTYHTWGGHTTSEHLHHEPWLDLNTMQSGHGAGRDVPVWEWITRDYNLTPIKPTLDSEPNYEDHPVNPWPQWNPQNGFFTDYDVRKQLYRSVFAGGCGVTYGHHCIWQMYDKGRILYNQPPGYQEYTWKEALDRPGARQVRYLRALMESRPFLNRIPDQSILISSPGEKGSHVRATRDAEGRYALIYLPLPLPVTVNLQKLNGSKVKAWWYNPCNGKSSYIGIFPSKESTTFTPPGDRPDWVLVLDDTDQSFPPPGRKFYSF